MFLVSIITLVIVPYTAYLLFGGDDDSVRYHSTLQLTRADAGMRRDLPGNRTFGWWRSTRRFRATLRWFPPGARPRRDHAGDDHYSRRPCPIAPTTGSMRRAVGLTRSVKNTIAQKNKKPRGLLRKLGWKLGVAWAVYAFLIAYVRTHQVVMERYVWICRRRACPPGTHWFSPAFPFPVRPLVQI